MCRNNKVFQHFYIVVIYADWIKLNFHHFSQLTSSSRIYRFISKYLDRKTL